MVFIVKTMNTLCKNKKIMGKVISTLKDNGYLPLITSAKQQFLMIFDEKSATKPVSEDVEPDIDVFDEYSDAESADHFLVVCQELCKSSESG